MRKGGFGEKGEGVVFCGPSQARLNQGQIQSASKIRLPERRPPTRATFRNRWQHTDNLDANFVRATIEEAGDGRR